MSNGAQQQQGQGDNSLGALWITIAVLVLAGVIWIAAKDYIIAGVLAVRLVEIKLISLVTDQLQSLAQTLQAITPRDYRAISFQQLADVSTAVGNYLRYPVAVILVGCAVFLYFRDPTSSFRQTYSMTTLRDAEKFNWPIIKPVGNLNLVDEAIDKGPWAMAQTPKEFAKKYHLLREKTPEPDPEQITHLQRPIVVVRKNEARKVFAMQLGPFWDGIDKCDRPTQAMFAIMAAQANRDRPTAEKLLNHIAASTETGKIDFSPIDEALARYQNSPVVERIVERHAYVLTVMASMLQLARTDGVLASAQFLWLKVANRPLWYMLNCVGRQTVFPEISGAFAHWLAEKEYGARLIVPMIEEAVKGLELAMDDLLHMPEDEETA